MRKTSVELLLIAALVGIAPCSAQTDPASLEKNSVDILLAGANDKSPDRRREAVIASSLIGPHQKVIEFLVSKLADEDVPVRLAAIGSLLDLGDERVVKPLESALRSEVPEVAFAAARSLYAMKQDSGREALREVAGGQSKTDSGFVATKKRGVLRQLKTPKSTLLFAFRSGAGFIPVPGLGAGIGAAQSLMSDGDFSGRASALLLLGRERDGETETLVRMSLADSDWSVRAAAIQVVGFWNRPEMKDELVPLLEDKQDKVRFRAAAAYIRLRLAERLTK